MDKEEKITKPKLIFFKHQSGGRWLVKHSLNGNMWADIEIKGKLSKWIALRAPRVLKERTRLPLENGRKPC